MLVATRFSIAVHILSFLGIRGGENHTSEEMAWSIGVNAVVVRRIMGMLRRAGLVRTRQGHAGAELARPVSEITLLDVMRAVETKQEAFSIHSNPDPNCPIGSRIQSALEVVGDRVQTAMEQELERTTIKMLASEFGHKAADRRRRAAV